MHNQPTQPGIQVSLAELIDMRHRAREVQLFSTQAKRSPLAGLHHSKLRGRGVDFDQVRAYQPGDDVRTIDWRVTARTGKVHTKLFREEKERPVFILTDLGSSMQFGSELLLKSVQACHLAALIAWHVKKTGDKLGGIVFHQQQIRELKPAGRSQAVLRYLHHLTELQQQALQLFKMPTAQGSAPIQLSEALGQLRRLARPGSLLFIISDFQNLDDTCLRHLRALTLHNEVRICQLDDPLEQHLPAQAFGLARVSDGSEPVTLQLGSTKLQQQYQQQQQLFSQQLQQHWTTLGLANWQFSAAMPLLSQLNGRNHGYS